MSRQYNCREKRARARRRIKRQKKTVRAAAAKKSAPKA